MRQWKIAEAFKRGLRFFPGLSCRSQEELFPEIRRTVELDTPINMDVLLPVLNEIYANVSTGSVRILKGETVALTAIEEGKHLRKKDVNKMSNSVLVCLTNEEDPLQAVMLYSEEGLSDSLEALFDEKSMISVDLSHKV